MDLQEEIRRLAYELYERSGCLPGRCVENWLEAERIIMSQVVVIEEAPGAPGEETAIKPAKAKKAAAPKAKKTEKKEAGTRKTAAPAAKAKTGKKKT